MKFKLLYIILVLCNFTLIFSQNQPTGYDAQANLRDLLLGKSDFVQTFTTGYEGVRGTPNIFEDFMSGNIYFSNKTSISNISINYDCYNDHVMYSDQDKIYILNSQNIEYFTITGNEPETSFLFKQVFLPSEKKIVFLHIIYNKKSILFKRYLKEFIEADYTGPYNANRRYDEYTDKEKYYIKLPDKEILQIKSSGKSLKEIFGDQYALIRDFIKKEKIDLKDENDLIQLVSYYDQLSGD